MTDLPFITIIVPAFNEEDLLRDCILSLLAQDYKGRYEIMVINNASTDSTAYIAGSLGVKVIDEETKGYVNALRAGFSAATGDIIACTDADTRVPADWLTRIVSLLSSPDIVGCSGTFRFYDSPPWLNFLGEVFGKCNYHLAGANMAVWRKAYLASGGFNVKINMGADVELGQRMKRLGKVIIDKNLRVDTSGRRFQFAFFQTLWLYYLNDLWLLLFKRPLFYNFPNIRMPKYAVIHPFFKPKLLPMTALILMIGCFLLITESADNQLFGNVMAHGRQHEHLVALTFDDGPSCYTSQILDTLDKYNVKATFFEIGKNVEKYPAISRRIVNEGHVLGNHTYSHPFWAPMESPARIKKEIDKAANAIQKATGVSTVLFRPPHGWRSPWMENELKKDNYTVVTWTVSPNDWKQNISAATVENRVVSNTHSGSIILMHDGLETKDVFRKDQTINALPYIIDHLKKRGYRFVTIPELIEASVDIVPKNVTIRQ